MFIIAQWPNLNWSRISDTKHNMVRVCETLAKMVCRCSLLESDDVRLKDQLHSSRTCLNCDLYAIEDARHVVLQCAYTQDNFRAYMLTDIYANVFNAKKLFENSPGIVIGEIHPWVY